MRAGTRNYEFCYYPYIVKLRIVSKKDLSHENMSECNLKHFCCVFSCQCLTLTHTTRALVELLKAYTACQILTSKAPELE